MPDNPYEELGVPEHASLDEIREAYQRLARRYDPVSGDFPNAARMADINRAFDALVGPGERVPDMQLPAVARRDAMDIVFGVHSDVTPVYTPDEPPGPRLSDEEYDELLQDAQAAAESGDWDDVIALTDEILASDPQSSDALLLRIEAMYEREDWQQVLAAVWAVLELEPDSEEALLYGAGAAAELDDWLEVRGFAATALLLDPTSDEARSWWSDAQQQLHAGIADGDPDEA